jgi:hypothetical protein
MALAVTSAHKPWKTTTSSPACALAKLALACSAAQRAMRISQEAEERLAGELGAEQADAERACRREARRRAGKARVAFRVGAALEAVRLFDPDAPLPGFLFGADAAAAAPGPDASTKHELFEQQAQNELRSERAHLCSGGGTGADAAARAPWALMCLRRVNRG